MSLFLDGELDEIHAINVRTHLSLCPECARVCEDFAAILDNCKLDEFDQEIVPPNPNALWCRISNTIETEITKVTKPFSRVSRGRPPRVFVRPS